MEEIKDVNARRLLHGFRFLCAVSALALTIFCIVDFCKNKNTSTISYKTFNEDDESPNPQVTFCFEDYSKETYLSNNIGYTINASSFADIYIGNEWDPKVLQIPMKKVHDGIQDIVIQACIKKLFDKTCDGTGELTTIIRPQGQKCISYHFKDLWSYVSANLWVDASLLPNHPDTWTIALTFPNQLLSNTVRWRRIKIEKQIKDGGKNSTTSLQVRDVEVIQHRNTKHDRCYRWKEYDNVYLEKIMKSVGCKPFYANLSSEYPFCNSINDMKAFWDTGVKDIENIPPPCIELRKCDVEVEDTATDATKEDKIFPGIGEKLQNTSSWFRISVDIIGKTFKNIEQNRAYTFQTLVGNAGGYVGLFIGTTIAELPYLMFLGYKKLIQIFSEGPLKAV